MYQENYRTLQSDLLNAALAFAFFYKKQNTSTPLTDNIKLTINLHAKPAYTFYRHATKCIRIKPLISSLANQMYTIIDSCKKDPTGSSDLVFFHCAPLHTVLSQPFTASKSAFSHKFYAPINSKAFWCTTSSLPFEKLLGAVFLSTQEILTIADREIRSALSIVLSGTNTRIWSLPDSCPLQSKRLFNNRIFSPQRTIVLDKQ